ncbi:MAG: AAA family ATPase [Deltaproteobacteria bacterium]|jgi:class 3 adenylate cyclase/tetratricopeptide (TPR) repeat protein|nr:AAA family ATPase [Deltaproteobacteria bacterium]
MKCPNCGLDNRGGANFCIECGSKLEIPCVQCHHLNLPASKFCEKCGFKLVEPFGKATRELSYDEKLKNIQKYLPEGLREKILSQKDRIEGERKQVTVLFADMEGYTGFLENLGIEETYNIMDKVYEILIHKVHDYEGVVNEMTGDGIMALFGAPVALEDAPQKAVRTAFAIHKEIAKFSDRLKQQQGQSMPIKMRIGIHTGPVVVGTLGNDLRLEFKAVGDTVNLASRMEGLAEPGTTCVSEETFRLTEGFFRYEALGEKKIKGKEEPIKVYQFIAPSARKTRFDVSAERGLTPFIGRDRELELLIDGFERSKNGKGRALSIVAEAGGGKSRLLYEFRKRVSNENITFLEGKCLSYSKGIAYHPIIDILKSVINVKSADGETEIKEKTSRTLRALGVDEISTMPYLLELLSVEDSGIDAIPMSSEARQDRILDALRMVVLKIAEIRPLIVAIEDLHWIDRSSEAVLRYFLEKISKTRIFLIFNYRPQYACAWKDDADHSEITLNRLSNRESLRMIHHILGTSALEGNLENLSLEKTEGIPFFIEEFVKSLKDLKLAIKKEDTYCLVKDFQDMTIPSTLQDVIMARVDALPKTAKDILQTGAVIEREFSYGLVKRVTGLSEKELLSNLSFLKSAELIYERGVFPKSSYVFKHALTRKVVYDSILTRKKKKLHETIGKVIEKLSEDSIERQYGVLAEHFISSGNYEKGAKFSRLAERAAEKAGSLADALTYAQKRIDCLENLPKSDDVQKELIDARTILGLYSIQSGFHAAANQAVAPVLKLAESLDYKRRLSQIYTIIGTYNYMVEENFPEALKNLEAALNISVELDDMVSTLFSNFWSAIVRSVNCEFEKADTHLTKALEINLAANSLWGVSIIKSNLSYFIYFFQGRMVQSYQISREALEGANESGDIFSKAMATVCHGIACYGCGSFDKAILHLTEGCQFCDKIKLVVFHGLAHFFMGEAYFETGNFKMAEVNYREAIDIFEHNRIIPSWKNVSKSAIEKMKVINKDSVVNLSETVGYAEVNKARIWDGWIRRNIGEILINSDDQRLDEAEAWIEKAIEADSTNGTLLNLGRNYALYAELCKRKGERDKAQAAYKNAIKVFKDCGSDGFLKRAEESLASIV